MFNQNFGIIFFANEAKNGGIALATASIFNEISEKNKPKLIKDNFVLVLK